MKNTLLGVMMYAVIQIGWAEDVFQDKTIYGVPLHSYNGSDLEKMYLRRLFEEDYRTFAQIPVPYTPGNRIKTLEGWYPEADIVPQEGAKPGGYIPTFRNIYDPQGRIVEKYEYYHQWDAVMVNNYYRFSYDSKNHLTEYKCYGHTGDMIQWRKFKYDSMGNLVEEDILPGAESKAKFTWDGNGHLLAKNVMLFGGFPLAYKATYQGKNLMEEANYIVHDKAVNTRWTYKYDARGNRTERVIQQVAIPTDIQKEIYTYDSSNRLIQTDHFEKWSGNEVYLTSRLKYKYTGNQWTQELTYNAQDELTLTRNRTYSPQGKLLGQDTFYHDFDYGGPNYRYMAKYDGAGNLVEETQWQIDGYTEKLMVQDKLVLTYNKDNRITSWEYLSRGQEEKVSPLERFRFFYDASNNIIRDEYWQYDTSEEKLILGKANIYRYDGVEQRSVQTERLPVLTNRLDYTPEPDWNYQAGEDMEEYRFKP